MSGAQKNRLSVWKALRWAITAVMLISLALMLRRPATAAAQSLPAAISREDNQHFQSKWADLQRAHERGEAMEARFTADEVNAALEYPGRPGHVSFADDLVTGEFITDIHGKDVYVTISGKLGAADGYLTLQPVQLKIGDLPVPISMLKGPLEKKLAEAQTRDRLKLPEYISDLRIERGELVVLAK